MSSHRRIVRVPFIVKEMQEAFVPIAKMRERRNRAKFNTPVGMRQIKKV